MCFSSCKQKVAISPNINPELYSAWLTPPVPVYLKIYIFNVTNSEDVRRGSLPALQECGPFVFLENRTKVDISHDEASDTITYKEFISYHFRPEMSGKWRLEDVVTIVNVPFAVGGKLINLEKIRLHEKNVMLSFFVFFVGSSY